MEKRIVVVFLAVLQVFTIQNLYAQDDGTTMVPIIEKTQSMVNYVEDELEQEIVRIEMDILQSSKTTYRNLQKGYTYTIIAYGDYRFKDIDVKVYRWNGSEWVVTKSDADSSSVALVMIKPITTSDYKIEVTAYKFNEGYTAGHYGLIVCHEK